MSSNSLLARRAAALSPASFSGHAGMIPFESGDAFPGIFPDLTEHAELALTKYRAETLQYAPRPGLPEMREWVAQHLTADGAPTSRDEVLMSNGAKHGIDLLCWLLLEPGDSIVVTAPTYFTVIPIFKSHGVSFIEVGQDAEGIDVAAIEASLERLRREGRKLPKFIYNVPEFHNPTSVTMSRRRREALIELAARYGVLVLEDSPYRKIRFEGADEPSLKGLDTKGCVITVGTFSKLVAPGLRVGWVTAPPDFVGRMAQLKSDGGSSPLLQRIILEYCKAGGIEEHTTLAQDTYRAHRDRMVQALRRELPEVSFTVPQGGYYVWVTLPEHVDGEALAKRAAENHVLIIPGSKFFAGTGHPKNNVRLAYSFTTPEEIDKGVRGLGRAYASLSQKAEV